MKQTKLIFLLLAATLPQLWAAAQTGYIYVHLKSINEQNSTDFPFVLKNSSGTQVSSFSLNDEATYDNGSGLTDYNYFNTLDLGLSHGTGGDGQLWEIVGTTIQATGKNNPGNIYYRPAGSSQWVNTSVGNAWAVDGAYANQVVYSGGGNVYFYNLSTADNEIYTGANATDVTANGGKVAIVANGVIEVYSKTYTAGASLATGGTWTALKTVNTITRIDMSPAGDSIVYIQNTSATSTVTTVGIISSSTGSGRTLTLPTGTQAETYSGFDIAYDDLGTIYAILDAPNGQGNVYSYSSGTWTDEVQSREISTVTGGAGHMVLGANYEDQGSFENAFSRQTDNLGNIYWVDDDRVKNSSSLNGNGIVIPVSPGTYTLTETMPSGYDLGRYNIYDPGGSTTGNVNANTITFVVTANEVVFGEYINEKLNPKAIALTCAFQYLQTFDASNSSTIYTYTFGSAAQGTPLEGTAYHYSGSNLSLTDDGYYTIAKTAATAHFGNTTITADHTGNGGYFLAVNASYSKDEFYRQRVTNLVPGVSYTISFWAANLSPSASLLPDVTYGLQDSLGNVVNSATSGNITSAGWTQYSFTFTATTSQSDLFLTNAAIGGAGNDIAIDDISLNPIIPTLGVNSGSTTECVGSNYTFTNSPSGGIWTSSSKTVATINAKSGNTKAVGAGTAVLTYTYTNSIGCTVTANSTVSVTAPPVVTATDKFGGSVCLGQPDSLYTNFTTTSTAPYTYAWSVSPTSGVTLTSTTTQNTSATATTAGTYTFTTYVTDSLGCAATASVAVVASNNSAPTVAASANITSAACISPAALTLSGGVSGSLHPNYNYVWSGPGTIVNPSSGSISATSYNTTASSSTAGHYTLTVTDANGCVGTATTTASSPAPIAMTASSFAPEKCTNTADTLYAVASGGTGTLSYAWTSTSTPTGTSVSYQAANAATTAISFGGGTANSKYAYTFTATVTDASGCKATASTMVNYDDYATAITMGTINAAASKCLGGSIALSASLSGGTTPYVYTWTGSPAGNGLTGTISGSTSSSPITATATPTAAGSYIYTIKVVGAGGTGCAVTESTGTQTINPAVSVIATGVNPAFCGTTSTDQLLAIASGGSGTYSTYTWATPTTVVAPGTSTLSSSSIYNPVASLSGAATGSDFKYTVTVTDKNGCTGTGTTTDVVVAGAPTISSVTATASSTCATNTTTINLSGAFSGGTSPYNYAWTAPTNSTVTTSSGTATTSPITASATAPVAQNYTYGLTIVDANNCTATGSNAASPVAIGSSLTVTASASNTGPICFSPATSINLTSSASGGSGTYTYAWAGPGGTITTATSQNPTAVPTTTGTYTVTVNDGAGCTGTGTTATVTVDQATPSISISCGTNASGTNYAQLSESNGTSWLWTTTSGGRFYTSNALSANSDGNTSTLQAPFIDFNGTYSVAITDANGCNGSGSIPVSPSSCSGNILAISGLNFTAEKENNTALLAWSTASETNNSYFNIERSSDGSTWQVIGTVNAQGNSATLTKYSFTDALPLAGSNYYRLKQVDVNGQYSYSPVKYLVFTGQWLVKLYPNPVQNYLVLEFNNGRDEKANIVIQGVLGNTVYATEQQLTAGLNRIVLNQAQQLAAGTYILVMGTTENTFRSKFVKGGN